MKAASKAYYYDPSRDKSGALSFADVAREFPYSEEVDGPRTRVADFAEIGYCVYKGWHYGHQSPERRSEQSTRDIMAGQLLHDKDEAKLLDAARALPKATAKQLANPFVNISEIPNFPGRIRMGSLTYGAKVDGAARADGNLLIREMKNSPLFAMTDHKLQAWAYCLTAPGALVKYAPDFQANGVFWKLDYPKLSKEYGPFPFTVELREIIVAAMEAYDFLFTAGSSGSVDLPPLPTPNPKKCARCSFLDACKWQTAKLH